MPFEKSTGRGRPIQDLTGLRFNKFEVLRLHGIEKGRTFWWCRCECGKEKKVSYNKLKQGKLVSCGCHWRRKKMTTSKFEQHGLSGTPEYNVWQSMLQRCYDESYSRYEDCGGRGIKVCDSWHAFTVFLGDMGTRPSPKHSIDRFPNNDGNYEPGNCRWATQKEQTNNTRANRKLTLRGVTKNLTEWSAETGLGISTIWCRIDRRGWSVERALTEKLIKARSCITSGKLTATTIVDIRDQYASTPIEMQELADRYGVSKTTIWKVIHQVKHYRKGVQ